MNDFVDRTLSGPGPARALDRQPGSASRSAREAPIVSVLVPVFDADRYLESCVESLLNQTLRSCEFLFCDDRSRDGSLERLRALAGRDHRIRVFANEENLGVAATRNRLFPEARGTYIAVMDADDITLPERLERQVSFLERHPEVVCVGSHHAVIDQDSRLMNYVEVPSDDATIQDLALAGHGSICHPSATIRASALRRIGGYCEDFRSAADLDLFLRLGEVGHLSNLDEVLLCYRIHARSVSGSDVQGQRANAREICARACARRGINRPFEAGFSWRPTSERVSRFAFHLEYGWKSWQIGEHGTAAGYARKALGLQPWSRDAWVLLAKSAARTGGARARPELNARLPATVKARRDLRPSPGPRTRPATGADATRGGAR